jgi:thiamine pyrophosphate-dependent acetolactate synthase large subunit-like protein
VFGNSPSKDAQFYEALVDRPQLKYILTPQEGPGAAMAAGYVKASGEPAFIMQAAVVGLMNAMGQMYNAFKEQTPLVFYSYRTDQTRRAGRDGFEEVANQEQIVQPFTKHTWLARRPDMIPETVRRAFKASWTPPYGPSYISWHKDYNQARIRADVVAQNQIDLPFTYPVHYAGRQVHHGTDDHSGKDQEHEQDDDRGRLPPAELRKRGQENID